MQTLAFAASNSLNSINKALLQHAANVLRAEIMDTEIELFSVRDFDLPIYCIDTENEMGIPEPAQALFEKIGAADQLLFAFAEHNGSYTAGYKSLFDWMSRIETKVFQAKPMVALATSPGGGGARNVLGQFETSAPHFKADLKATFSAPKFYDVFDSNVGQLTDAELQVSLRSALSAFKQ
ncbi:MAG: NAD(P)H-dependent oxidoreductase [Pseudomonadota bacterium]